VRNEKPSRTIDTTRITTATAAESSGCGCLSFSTPSNSANSPPRAKRSIETTNAQKYRSRPYPNGCARVAARLARWSPRSKRPWFPVSATEWTPSASIAEDPVTKNPTNFATAIPPLAISAATTARREL